MLIVSIFDVGNSSDAFLGYCGRERGMSALNILLMLAAFNLIYTVVSTPAGALSDIELGRRKLIIGGWIVYALIYLGFALARSAVRMSGFYMPLTGFIMEWLYGTAKAMVADLVPADLRLDRLHGTWHSGGILDFPASLIAGLLWGGVGSWNGFGPSAPFYFGAGMALLAAVLFVLWKPKSYPG